MMVNKLTPTPIGIELFINLSNRNNFNNYKCYDGVFK